MKIWLAIMLSSALADPLVHVAQSAPGTTPPVGQVQVQAAPPETANPDAFYSLGPDSLPQQGVPKGEIRGPFTLPSNAYPGTQHT